MSNPKTRIPKKEPPSLSAEDSNGSTKNLKVPKPGSLPRRELAKRRFGVSDKKLQFVPKITPILRSSIGSAKKAIELLRFSNDPAAVTFFEIYDGIQEGDRESISIEAVCVKAEISTPTLLGAALLIAQKIRGTESAMLAVNAHPKILRRTIELADLPGGFQDRKVLHEAIGFLPSSKGMNIAVNLGGPGQLAGGTAPPALEAGDSDEPSEEAQFSEMFPSVNKQIEKWSDSKRKMLAEKVGV
jgi:hypothetical protein